ncbi:MAG: stage V sporulation protein AD [Lachnospiraceae bacterium]|nr:stage V sporulation protein AD [Lachnospiraceae bacterium]
MIKQLGTSTLEFTDMPRVLGYAAVVGKKEGEGPLKDWFDKIFYDTSLGNKSWEKAESLLQCEAVSLALQKANVKKQMIDYIFAGDLLNQCVSSSYGLRDLEIPFLGQYGACSTMAQTISMASVFAESGAANACAAVTSSHFCSAERQFRFPLQYGGQRTPTAQWTVTGSGSVIVGAYKDKAFKIGNEIAAPNGSTELAEKSQIAIRRICTGKIIDMGITDANNMGAAMAGAAADTIYKYFKDTGTTKDDYDMVITGDLGLVGTELLYELLDRENINLREKHKDCGLMIYNREEQDVHSGGSGCGCSGSVLCAYFLNKMKNRELNNILFVATGALMSPTVVEQGESIPGIAHLINFINSTE